jgi:hypothetical protein
MLRTKTSLQVSTHGFNSFFFEILGDNFMSASSFSNTYYGGAAIFDSACQNPSQGYGAWNEVINNWSEYRSRWNC